MPKRLFDSSFLTSPSVARLSPACQDAMPRLILVADDFGTFDSNPRVLVGKAWPLRPDVTEDQVAGWLAEMECEGMLERWVEGGRTWGFLTGWFGPHGQRRRDEYHPTDNPKGSKRHAVPPSQRRGEVSVIPLPAAGRSVSR